MYRGVKYAWLLVPLALLMLAAVKVRTHPPKGWSPEPPPAPAVLHLEQMFADSADIALFGLVALASLPLGLCVCTVRRQRRGSLDVPDVLVSHVTCGLISQSAIFALLVTVGSASAWGLMLAELALMTLGGAVLVVLARRWPGALTPRQSLKDMIGYLAAATALFAVGYLSVRFGRDNGFDMLNYHYYNAHAWLNGRFDFDYTVADYCTFYNPLGDLPFYFLVRHLRPIWVGFTLGVLHAVPAVLLFALSYRILTLIGGLDRTLALALALVCTIAGIYEPVSLAELGTVFHDNALAGLVLASLLLLTVLLPKPGTEPGGVRYLSVALAGLLTGVAIGLKLTFATFGVAGLIALIVLGDSWKQRCVIILCFGAGSLAGLTAAYGHWAIFLYMRYGSPTLPFFNSVFQSPYWPTTNYPIFPTPAWDWTNTIFLPFYVAKTQRLVLELPFRDGRLAAAFIMLALVCVTRLATWLFARSRAFENGLPRAAVFIGIFCLASYGIWLYQFRCLRYLCPVNLLIPLLLALLLKVLLGEQRRTLIAAACVCFGIVATVKVGDYGRWKWTETFFDIDMPGIDNPDTALVLTSWRQGDDPASVWPVSHVVTALPSGMRFIKIDSTLLWEPLKMHQEARSVIREHQGPIYLLTHWAVPETIRRERLTHYGLTLGPTSEVKHIRAGVHVLVLWPIIRELAPETPSPPLTVAGQ